MTRWIAIYIILILACQVEAGGMDGPVSIEEMAYQELKIAILCSDEMGLDQSALILTLGYTDSSVARQVLVEIADYYLGSAVAESVVSSVSQHGRKILSDLDEAIGRDSTCVANDRIKCLPAEDRVRFLKRLREIASTGEPVEYVW